MFEKKKKEVKGTWEIIEKKLNVIDEKLKIRKPLNVEKFLNQLTILSPSYMAAPASLKHEID